MGFLDTLLGRTKPVPPKLDDLFEVPTAAITLQASMGLVPTGTGSVCFRAAEGRAFSDIEKDVRQLLSMGSEAGQVEVTNDSYGFTWLVCRHAADDVGALVTDLHAVNTSLVDAGFGSALLCTLVAFTNGTRSLGLVYLYKRGTWYPFVPVGGDRRDNATELQIRSVIGTDLRFEEDLARWFPVYGAPGL